MGDSKEGRKASSPRRKRGRQQVRRHFKPTLGRWVDTYDRTGEHARQKEKAIRRGAAGEPERPVAPAPATTAPAPPRRGRLIALACVAMLVGLVTLGAAGLVARGSGPVEYEILATRRPLVVMIRAAEASRMAAAAPHELDGAVADAVALVRAAASEQPDGLVVIDLASPPISFTSLPAAARRELERAHGPAAAAVYESAVAGFLERVIRQSGGRTVCILGLPVEPGEAGPGGATAARLTNQRYRAAIDRLDPLVSAHTFFRTETTLSEKQMVLEGIPEAVRLSDGRPVVFRQNLDWRVLVDRDRVTDLRDAPWHDPAARTGR